MVKFHFRLFLDKKKVQAAIQLEGGGDTAFMARPLIAIFCSAPYETANYVINQRIVLYRSA